MTDSDHGGVSAREKDLAAEALAKFNKQDYSASLSSLEQLEVLRPTDVKLAHNKIVAECRMEGSPVSLSEVVQQLEGLAKTAGVDLSGTNKEDDTEWTVLTYNLAVAKFQQRHILQASQLASRLHTTDKTNPEFRKRILFLNAELSLALRQPEEAIKYANKLQPLVDGNNEDDTSRLMILKARCQVLNRKIKSLKKELKSVTLPGAVGVTCEFVRSHIEFQCGNFRKSIKMLNSAVQAAGSRVFPHYYNNLGCIHQNMKKPNLAVYYFKNALERLEASQGGGAGTVVPSQTDGGKESTSWLTQSQVLYNISLALLHAKRPHTAFELLLEVVASHYLDPHVWFHLAECCVQHHQPDNLKHFSASAERAAEVCNSSLGAGLSHKMVASNPTSCVSPTPGTVPDLSLDFAYVCLKNAESLLPKSESESDHCGFCSGVGYIGNPLSWAEVEQLRIAIISAKSYVALSVGDFVLAGSYATDLLDRHDLPGAYKMLAHLYAAESLILQDKLSDAIKHLDPDNIGDVNLSMATDLRANQPLAAGWSPSDLSEGRAFIQYNLAVGFSLREEWAKAASLAGPLYKRNSEISVQVLLLNLYIALSMGDGDRARQLVRDRCPVRELGQTQPNYVTQSSPTHNIC